MNRSSEKDIIDKKIVQSMGCQYIPSNQHPYLGNVTFCGCKELFNDSSYCKDHYFNIYDRGTNLRARPKEQLSRHAAELFKKAIMDYIEEHDLAEDIN